ncbi:glycosyltransferase [Paracoccus sp. MBLB3053]|uniref:Glycosyltransferase n=1 Tax=Paracoccus aurantius TaxID=3073814 RepID=A0ABU2HW34_9RHOB|nr:glycosyltransferase [Paracoccus sp. MBLB3053]MDS9468770.1 glycosyltransferase [Paracoccus sp. MBLB3053]
MKPEREQGAPIPDKVVIVNDASTAWGGATGLAILSAELLVERGISVTFVAGDEGTGAQLTSAGVEIVALGGRGLVTETPLRAATHGIYNPAARDLLAGWIATNDSPGVVYHLHGWSKILSPAIFDALRNVAERTFIHAHDFFLACPNGGYMDYRRNRPCSLTPLTVGCLGTNCDKRSYAQKLWRAMRQATLNRRLLEVPWAGVVMIHEQMTTYLEKAGLNRDLLVPLPNPTSPLTSERVRAEENRGFVFIGRVEAEKGIEDAIAATRSAHVELTVVGEGPLREALAAANPDILFTGWKSRNEMAEIVSSKRALLMPSRYPEPFGLVAIEAARSGLPVIIAETAFLSEGITRLGIGKSCNTRDVVAFAACIADLHDLSAEEVRRMSLRAMDEAGQLSTTPAQWVDHLLDLYGSALEGRHDRT